MSIKALQDFTYVSRYARYNEKERRRETWVEAVDRVQDMHKRKFPHVAADIDWAFDKVRQKLVLGSQRALQFGGRPIEQKNARMYNCLGKETEFITSEGVRSFADYNNGDECVVLTHKGNWKQAVVRCYGKQKLHTMKIARGRAESTVRATKNHRWLLKDGTVTQEVVEEDQLMFGPNVAEGFIYEESDPMERLYWAYGYVYGDGTRQKDAHGDYKYSQVRLCGEEIKYLDRFLELGFGSSTSASLEGDVMVYTGKYLKTLPNPKLDSPALIRAFIHGYLAADGIKNSNVRGNPNYRSPSPYDGIQATGEESVQFIRECFPIAGVYIVSEEDLTGQITNYGEREELTVRFRIISGFGKTAPSFTISEIETEGVEEEVWCLEVEEDQSFVLPNGLVTGNCCVSYCDRIQFFQECFWLLLCGCGTGFSAQKHHIAKLPDFFEHRTGDVARTAKKFVIPDSIEGWADALGILLATYMPHEEFPEWEGHDVVFDYSLIRPLGSVLASGVGKAPGPEPLRRALEIIRKLLDDRCSRFGRLRPIDAYDIIMHASDAVLSGGVRRSATICLFSVDDMEMRKAKTGNWFTENPQRARSNNSVLLLRGHTTKEQFAEIMKDVQQFGEPGYVWADSTELCVNPCVVGDTVVATSDGLWLATDLIDKKFSARVDGETHQSTDKGFWKTGNRQVLKLTFNSGREIKVTPEHKILTTQGWKQANDINYEDEIVINNQRSLNINHSDEEYAKGYCLGSFLADGNISKETAQMKWWGPDKEDYRKDALGLLEKAGWRSPHHKEESDSSSVYASIDSRKLYEFAEKKDCVIAGEKKFSSRALTGSYCYITALIAGYFDADGTVHVDQQKGSSVRIWSVDLDNLRNLQIGMNALGVYSKIYQDRIGSGSRLLPDGKGGYSSYDCQAGHELAISCDNIERFLKVIPLRNLNKWEKINQIVNERKRLPNRTNFVDKLIGKTLMGECDVYDCTIPEVSAFDANGVYVHNCVEIGMWPVHYKTGVSGWQMCNLCEINGRKIKHKEDFALAAKAAAIIGTLQASYTNFEYLGQTTKEIVEREALLGVSITGMMDNPDVIFDPANQQEMAKLILDTNEWMAKLIGINPAARATCVKPAGTTSCILGSASGIHPHHAKRYFRRIQGNRMEAPLQYFKQYNAHAVEKSVWSANKTDEVITFCVEVPDGAKTKNQLSALTLLEHVKNTQKNWVMAGKREEACTQPWLTHNVSNTINVRPEEWEGITDYIYDNREFFAGIALLPQSGDLDYPQAPFTTVHTAREIVQIYGEGSLFASGLIVHGLRAFDDNLWAACETVLGFGEPLVEPKEPELCSVELMGDVINNEELHQRFAYKAAWATWNEKKEFVRRAVQFANRYFAGDVRQMTYCLKEVHNWKQWQDLQREYKDVDYSKMIEETDETKPMDTIACAGGSCAV